MRGRRIGRCLSRDPVGRTLPWLMAFMVYLGALAVAGFLIVQQVASGWERGLAGVLTVQLPPAAPSGDGEGPDDVAAALAVLRATPGVARAEPMSDDEMWDLLSPWLSGTDAARDLPLPRLIEVTLAPGATVDMEALRKTLTNAVPAALVDDHGRSVAAVRTLATTVKGVGVAVILSIVLATMGTVLVVTRAAIGLHDDTIEVLHLIGADDTFVARQFTGPVLRHALLGGAVGGAAAGASLLALEWIAADLSSGTVLALRLTPLHWAALAAVPVVAAALTLATTRVTVHLALAARV